LNTAQSVETEFTLQLLRRPFLIFIQYLLGSVYDVFNDIAEIRRMAYILFPKVMKPIQAGTLSMDDPDFERKLSQSMQVYISTALDKIFLRELSGKEIIESSSNNHSDTRKSKLNEKDFRYLNYYLLRS
jgi:hypothetical protein